MQQLTLQFEGFADEMRQPETRGTAQRCQSSAEPSWLQAENRIFSRIAGVSLSNLQTVQGSVAVVVSFLFIFTAALIGG